MTIIDDVTAAVAQAGFDDGIDPSAGYRCGWDYWIAGQPATDGCGIARTTHRLPIDLEKLPHGAVAIVDGNMTISQLVASLWRQCLIRPDDREELKPNPFAVSSASKNYARLQHLVTLIGHSPHDLALYLADLRLRNGTLFHRVLAKDFKGALALSPTIAEDPWPDLVREQWVKPETDYLPPFLVAVLYAELARLAVNQAGLLAMAFDEGAELSTRRFLPRVPLASTAHQPFAIKRAIEMLPYQSIALSAPGTVLQRGDAEAAAAWAKVCAASLTAAAEELDGIDVAPATPKQAKALARDFESSPAFWLEQRNGHGWSRQNRPAATRWGLDWRQHASVGLLEIMMTAQDWNERYRPEGPRLASMSLRRVSWAIATINYAWVAESNPAAALWLLMQTQGKKEDALPLVFGPFGMDHALEAKSGDTLRKKAMAMIADRPRPGELGYTARYQAHLWLNDRGDDIAYYRHYQWDAIVGYIRAKKGILPEVLQDTSRVPEEVVAVLGRTHGVSPNYGGLGHNQLPFAPMTDDIAAARGAQNVGMMISPLSTDPMREMPSRKLGQQKKEGKTKKR
ncbi:hypothetical protein ACNFJ7_02850 [Sphingomonas sp. HT-1]|uniref:hypothetical protein n=1 Tax=unclassified Sphingomonas TaxID=196159 RepID=UPI0002D5069D|nr:MULTISPECIES: hypothetical protein [unclassified Sphingomonas]KTF68980.1 hypothetical protein ATB93_10975 [Sphingomonas sp. WG]